LHRLNQASRRLRLHPQRPALRPNRYWRRSCTAGDIEAGTLLLDESSNGINLTASWDGRIVEGSCGRSIQGVWKDLSNAALPDAPDVPFVLTLQRGW
jgi:hypothetical protein